MNGKIALIDADSLCYYCSRDTLSASIDNLDGYLLKVLDFVEADSFILFLSEGKYFRHGVYPGYKANRGPTPLMWIKTLKSYFKERYQAVVFEGVEADDLVAYFADQISNCVVCTGDKDVLNQVPGKNLNFHPKNFGYMETSHFGASKYTFLQTLMGDSSDNITGIPGIGEVKASRILQDCNTIEDLQSRTFKAYLEHYGHYASALHNMELNFSLVYLLKRPEDYLRLFGKIPVLTKICEVKK